MTLETRLEWVPTWLNVAHDHLQAAHEARSRFDNASDSAAESTALAAEFHACLVAIAAAAFAIEAARDAAGLRDESPLATPSKPSHRDLNAGDWIAQLLIERALIDTATQDSLGTLFDLRHESVHPTHRWIEGTRPHPSGSYTSEQVATYSLERAEALVAAANRSAEALAKVSDPD